MTIKMLSFVPAEVHAKAGDVIVWSNQDFLAHTSTSPDAWDLWIEPHRTVEQTMRKPGVFEYYCRFHPNMRGVITVSPR